MKTLGIMSGTSADGIDLALIDDEPLTLLASDFVPFEASLKSKLLSVIQNEALTAIEFARLDAYLSQSYCDAISSFIKKHQIQDIQAIGLHGQTVAHLPHYSPANSWQIGHPSWVAAKTGIPVISDFRRTDMAYGGQGAPLAPALHQALFKQPDKAIAVLNLGGIANITFLNDLVTGFDVGPANCLLDEWCHLHTGQAFDNKGQWGQTGQVNQHLLEKLLSDAYFSLQPPKSTGREYFNQAWLASHLADIPVSPVDVQRTLIALLVQSVHQAISDSHVSLDQLIVVGGGVHNQFLINSLRDNMSCQVLTSDHWGISPDDIEAVLMAWLAARHCRGQETDLRAVTGCQKAHIYGIYFGV